MFFIGCKFSDFSVITQIKRTFFVFFVERVVIYQFLFVPLHPLFSCDGELSQTNFMYNNLI